MKDLEHLEKIGVIAPLGECKPCDRHRTTQEDGIFPWHRVKDRCSYPPDSRKPHCTCDSCF